MNRGFWPRLLASCLHIRRAARDMTSDILVVSADPHVLSGRVTALRRAGFSARACSSFPDARRTLEEGPPPEVLVTDVRLGPVQRPAPGGGGARRVPAHGRHRDRRPGPRARSGGGRPRRPLPARRRSRRASSNWRLPNCWRCRGRGAAGRGSACRPRWPAVVGGLPGRLLDVSYGGACLEVFGAALPATRCTSSSPNSASTCSGQRVWAHRADPLQPVSCGVAFDMPDDPRWQSYVDAVAAA